MLYFLRTDTTIKIQFLVILQVTAQNLFNTGERSMVWSI